MKIQQFGIASLLIILLLQCSNSNVEQKYSSNNLETKRSTFLTTQKINGLSFVSPSGEIGIDEIIKPKQIVSANYLSIMPYGFAKEGSTELIFNIERQWWGEKSDGVSTMIELAHAQGYKIMLKPHVWKRHGAYTGDHTHYSAADWEAFEDSYTTYILHFAKIAQAENVRVFCIGTEWKQFVIQRPKYWKELIAEVRKIYSGQLTYAANWDEYLEVPFWNELDFIGVDAYFPLAETKTPNVAELKKALLPFKNALSNFADSVGKPILFSEYGFRSRDQAAYKPWESDRNGNANVQTQVNAYKAFFATFWNEDFVAGGFLWKWFANYAESGGIKNNGFTPQNKPVEKVIRANYQ